VVLVFANILAFPTTSYMMR